jgi:hypothetical protein
MASTFREKDYVSVRVTLGELRNYQLFKQGHVSWNLNVIMPDSILSLQ